MTSDAKIKLSGRLRTLVTRHASHVTTLGLAAVILSFAVTDHAQTTPAGHAPNGFTAVDYYDAPNQIQMRSRLSGAEAQPVTGGLLVVKALKLEMFTTNGQRQVIIHAPECIYNTLKHTADSSGRLSLQNGDGKIRVEGTGFLWRQDDSVLTISNTVHTTIESDSKERFAP